MGSRTTLVTTTLVTTTPVTTRLVTTTLVVSAALLTAGLSAGTAEAAPAPAPSHRLPTPSAHTGSGQHATDHVLVRFRSGTTTSARSVRVRAAGGTALRAVDATPFDRVVTANPTTTLQRLQSDPTVAWAGYDYVRHAFATRVPTDPLYQYQTYLPLDRTANAWSISTGSAAQVVAVVDTGVDATAPDLAGHVLAGHDFVDGDSDASPAPADPGCADVASTGHGTFVASVAAAGTDNGRGIAGVAWTARVLPVRVLDACGEGFDSDIAAGVTWAVAHAATVVNLSLGGTDPAPTIQFAMQDALSHGVPVVVAAGNDGSTTPQYPAAYPEAISVGATDSAGHLTSFSSFGDWVDLAAPGWDIVGEEPRALCADVTDPHPSDCYYIGAGTSFAAPIVSGVVALLRARTPTLTASQVRARLLTTTRGGGPPGLDPYLGYGVVDAYGALGAPLSVPIDDSSLVPNQTPTTAVPFGSGDHALTQSGEDQWFSASFGSDTAVEIDAVPDALPGGVDRSRLPQQLRLTLRAYDAQRRLVGSATAVADGTAVALTTVMPAGTDLIELTNANGSAPASQPFALSMTSQGPATAGAPGAATWVEDYVPRPYDTAQPTTVHATVVFARAMDPTTLTASTVLLRNGVSGTMVPSSLSYDGPTRTLTVTPDDPLEIGTPYVLTVDAGSPAAPATDTLGAPVPVQRNRFTTTLAGTRAPVAGLVSSASKAVTLSWQMPDFGAFRNVAVYDKAGAVQPASPADGTLLYYGSLTSFTTAPLALGQDHSFSVFAYSASNALTAQTGVTVLGSTTSLSVSPVAPTYGQIVTVLATVRGSDGQPMAGRSVTMFSRRPGHPWGAIGTATTTAAGKVSVGVTPTQDTDFDAVAAGDDTHLASTAVVSVPLRFSVTATTVPPTAAVGSTIRFGGAVLPVRPGAQVWLEGFWSSTWHLLGTATLSTSGTYSFKLVPTRVSTYVYRVYKPADATLAAAATASWKLVTH